LLPVPGERGRRHGEHLARGDALFLVGRDDAGFDRGVDGLRRRTQVEGVLGRPLAGPLLLCLVKDHVHQRLAGFRIHLRENVPRDLDEVRLQLALIPFGKDVVQFRR